MGQVFRPNPEWIVPFSPGLPQRGYPGKEPGEAFNPNWGCASEVMVLVHRNDKTKGRSIETGDVWRLDGRNPYDCTSARAICSHLTQNVRVATLAQIVSYADAHLRIKEIGDWPNALNGLQIENSGAVTKIGAAVDASGRTIETAIARGINFLIVHHGLFWPGLQPITGGRRQMLQRAFEHDLALYSAHLPLDLHSVLGNNAQLAGALGFENAEPFFEQRGQCVGLKVRTQISRAELARKLEHSLGGPVKLFAAGPEETHSIALITGGAGSEIYGVAAEGVDTFITGEAPHWAAVAAEELGLNLLLGGHYATETFGVKALAAHLSDRFDLPWEFLDCATGL